MKKNGNVVWKIMIILMLIAASVYVVSAEDAQNAQQGQSVGQSGTKTTEEKFRVGPTVKIRPLNDQINKSADGIIELYFDNPSLNDVPLTVDVRIIVPSGINVYGQGFGESQAAGILYSKFQVPPGTVRTAFVNIKAEKTGDFYAQFSGLYYPGENKDDYQPISLTYPFNVYESSPDPKSAALTNPGQIPGKTGGSDMLNQILPGIIIAAMAGLIGLGYKIVEMKYQHKLESESKTTKSKTIEKNGKITEQETINTKTIENK